MKMMLQALTETAVIGIVRMQQPVELLAIARALREGGLCCLEITMNTPGALQALQDVSKEIEGVFMGVGTVLDATTARQALLAGAQFIVTPTVRADVAQIARRYGVPTIIGATTPTEILAAWEAGADMVKLFPASSLGAGYLRDVRGPLPHIPLVPTGGLSAETAGDFIRSGAAAVAVASWLVDKRAVAEERYDELTRRAKVLVEAVHEARDR